METDRQVAINDSRDLAELATDSVGLVGTSPLDPMIES